MRWMWMLGVMAMVACDGGETTDSKDTDMTDSDTDMTDSETDSTIVGDAAEGESVYTANCALCHQADGTGGGTYPDLNGFVDDGGTAEECEEYVVEGDGSMPAFGDQLTDQEIADVVAYVMENFGS